MIFAHFRSFHNFRNFRAFGPKARKVASRSHPQEERTETACTAAGPPGAAATAHQQFAAARLAKQTIETGGQPGLKVTDPGGVRTRTLQAHMRPRSEQETEMPESEPLGPEMVALNAKSLAKMQIDPGPSRSCAGSASGQSDIASTIGANPSWDLATRSSEPRPFVTSLPATTTCCAPRRCAAGLRY